MSSKLGIHVQRIVGGVEDFVKEAKPRVVKSLEHNPDFWREVKEASPDTFIVGRLYLEKQLLDDPIRRAREFCDELLPVAERMRGIYDAWEGYNEITCFDAETMRRYVDFEVERARIMHEEGFEVVVGNFSTGHPDLDMWEHFLPALREGDFLGLHEYDAPTMRRWETWLCLRYRRIYDRLPQDARPPLIITECGIDGGVIPGHSLEGWKRFASEEEYLSQLKWYDEELQEDDYVVGATIFLFGCYPQWDSFDISGEMAEKLSAYIQTTQVVPPPPKPWKKLEDYPRPANGSWRGMHGSAECHHRWATELEGKRRWLPIIKDLKIGWYKVLDDGSCDSIPLIKLLLAEGMKPIMRLYRGSPFPPPLKPKEAEAIRRLVEAGAIYFEVVNEPQFGDKPRGLETIVDNFIHNADLIHEAGGIPLSPSIGINHLEDAFKMVAAKGRRDIFEEGAGVTIHNYTLNHPLNYPYDTVNQEGRPLTDEEWALGRWAWGGRSREEIDAQRARDKNPGATALDDIHCWLGFQAAHAALRAAFGDLADDISIFTTEGGPEVGDDQDGRYPRTTPWIHRDMVIAINRMMQTHQFLPELFPEGVPPELEEPFPWYFAHCHWLLADAEMGHPAQWEPQTWVGHFWDEEFGLHGELPALQALTNLPLEEKPPEEVKLVNGDFEGGFRMVGAPEVTVAQGWEPWWDTRKPTDVPDADEPGYSRRPEFKPDRGRPAEGTCQKFCNIYATHNAGIYQKVAVPKRSEVTFRAKVYVWSSQYDDLSRSKKPGEYKVYVGIDPYGGTDALSEAVVWSEPKEVYDEWTDLSVKTIAQADAITVFLRGRCRWRVKNNNSYWDKCELLVVPKPPEFKEPVRILMPNGEVVTMELEEYLRGVVPSVMDPSWPEEALKAQAVAARSFALYVREHGGRHEGADLCTTEHCQLYDPDRAHPATDAAIEATKGLVAIWEGKPIKALYTTDCGGHTLNNEDSELDGKPVHYLRGVPCIHKGERGHGVGLCQCLRGLLCVRKGERRGHGVGLCQWGAHDMAEEGAYFRQIIRHYYTGVRLSDEPLDYRSHFVLFPQGAPWELYEAAGRYISTFRVTLGQSLDDAVAIKGPLGHVVTCINPSENTLDFLRGHDVELDVIRADSPEELRAILDARVESGERFPFRG